MMISNWKKPSVFGLCIDNISVLEGLIPRSINIIKMVAMFYNFNNVEPILAFFRHRMYLFSAQMV